MIDLLYLAHGRPEFTEASTTALLQNTDWSLIRKVHVYLDGTRLSNLLGVSFVLEAPETIFHHEKLGGPVAIMQDYLQRSKAEILVKIDNDVICPPGWLNRSVDVMESYPELDLLGIEPPESRTANPFGGVRSTPPEYISKYHHVSSTLSGGYATCDSIGGIGLMRRSCFVKYPDLAPQNVRGGFTDWQLRHTDIVKGWIIPPLQVFLLDRLPIEKYQSLSKRYIAEGVQRYWTPYDSKDSALWGWWTMQQNALGHVQSV